MKRSLPTSVRLHGFLLSCALLASASARAVDKEEELHGAFEAWLSAGGSAGRQDVKVGLINRRGYGLGIGVLAGAPIPTFVVENLFVGPWAGGEAMGGGSMNASRDEGLSYSRWNFEFGGQAGYLVGRTRLLARVGKYWLNDASTSNTLSTVSFSGWLARLRADRGKLSAEVGFGFGDARLERLVLRYRQSFLVCPGIMLEHHNQTGFGQTSSTHLRAFWSVDF